MSGNGPLVDDDIAPSAVPDATTQKCSARPYSIYVLLVLLVTYLLNQLDRYMLGIVTKPMSQEIGYGDFACMKNNSVHDAETVSCNATSQTDCESTVDVNGTRGVCEWNHNGQGMEYEILAGPVFIVIYTLAGIPLGLMADFSNRRNLLAGCLFLWSAMTLVSGFVQRYWQLVITRFLLGVGQAGCTPFSTSLIADYFGPSQRALALSFYNWGIYIGYSMSYALGNYVTISLGWRWAWYISGAPGILITLLILITVREPQRHRGDVTQGGSDNDASQSPINMATIGWRQKVSLICSTFFKPSLLVLCVAGSIRNAAGYVWAYNTQIYFQDMGTSPHDIARYMSWIPLVFGCIGVVLGGFIADRVVKRVGVYARVCVLIASQALAVPFVAGALYLRPPWAFMSLIPAYLVGEMWVGITLAVVIEVVPVPLRTSAVAVYMFIISNVGGNMPLLVPPLKNAFQGLGWDVVTSLRAALYILYPGLYILGALLFVAALLTLRWDLRRHQYAIYQPVPTDD